MTTTAQAVGAPQDVELAGEKFRMSPLTDADWGEFERHIQARAIAIARRNLDGLPAEDRKTLLEAAFATAYRLTLTSPDAMTYMVSREGVSFLTWLGLRKNHPDVTPDRVRELLADERTIRAAMDAVDDLNHAGGEGGSKKKQRGRSTKATSTSSSPTPTAGPQASSGK